MDTPEEELALVRGLKPSAVALVHREFEDVLGSVNSPGESAVELKQYHPEGSRYRVQSERGGLLVLSEVHYPVGWSATLDGSPIELVRANALLMALEVPAGEHDIQLQFEPEGWSTARGMSRAGSLMWMLLLGLCFWQHRRTEQG